MLPASLAVEQCAKELLRSRIISRDVGQFCPKDRGGGGGGGGGACHMNFGKLAKVSIKGSA